MYSLDINFLNDRTERQLDIRPVQRDAGRPGDRRAVLFGAAVVVAALALVGGYWLVLRSQVQQLQARDSELDQEIQQVQNQLQELSGLRAQIDAVRSEIQAFVSIFDQILPWSALMQDLRNLTPSRVQIESLTQTAGDTLTDSSGAEPPPSGGIEVVGKACTFDDINDFLLLLQRSPLLDGNSVRLTRSQRPEDPLPVEEGTCPGSPQDSLTFLVDYTIRANLTPTPSTELIEELEGRGTVGLVSRLRALRETGVLGGAAAETAVTEVSENGAENEIQE